MLEYKDYTQTLYTTNEDKINVFTLPTRKYPRIFQTYNRTTCTIAFMARTIAFSENNVNVRFGKVWKVTV